MLTIVARHRGMIAKEGLFGCASSADALRVEAAILVESTTRRCLSQIVAPLGERYSFRGMASSAGDPPLDRGSAADAEEFINSNLVERTKKDVQLDMLKVATTRREAISLYRSIWRGTRLFMFRNERGELWKDTLREASRKEFEAGRLETDPEIVTRLIVAGRDYYDQAMEKFMAKRQQIINEEHAEMEKNHLRRSDDD
mmetsp:Transcript_26422/g.49861  ORF Transcript_26422/g.49861 Transcript_26422/m.49861 type:complete len:199 (-) Transcript_26422:256-852(-)|eukprot:CAMPEP_0114311272 /NCGR_PEP_ID=MMETSP0059-20121206/19728_1 /TAXON_ID=36894 /ORGANISM="Pyramimonas parkeae, Strain CCMP726" /LENGTH=198 /DNA_ID=CAMNT_0001435419 /DNA_START=42 /DNA_END=638 /DNA_ORIENTATION=+